MKYSIDSAKEYSKKNKLDKWLQLFLRDSEYENASPNIALADGLLLEERFYTGPILLNLDEITPVRTDEGLLGNELLFYQEKEDKIVENYENFNLPPLILEYKDDKLYLVDGNHRYTALRKLNINEYYVIIWGNKNLENKMKKKVYYETRKV